MRTIDRRRAGAALLSLLGRVAATNPGYPPQVALVGFGKVVERPWAEDGRDRSAPANAREAMTEAEARTLLLRALGEVAPEVAVEAIDPALPLREQFDPDSLDFLNLVAALSDELGIDIPQRDYGSLDTPERATAYIGRIATSAAATVSSAPGGGSAIAVRPRSFVVLGSSSVVATVPPPPWRP